STGGSHSVYCAFGPVTFRQRSPRAGTWSTKARTRSVQPAANTMTSTSGAVVLGTRWITNAASRVSPGPSVVISVSVSCRMGQRECAATQSWTRCHFVSQSGPRRHRTGSGASSMTTGPRAQAASRSRAIKLALLAPAWHRRASGGSAARSAVLARNPSVRYAQAQGRGHAESPPSEQLAFAAHPLAARGAGYAIRDREVPADVPVAYGATGAEGGPPA